MADRVQDVPKQTVQMAGPSKHGDLGIHYFNYFYYLLQATDNAAGPTPWLLLGCFDYYYYYYYYGYYSLQLLSTASYRYCY